MVAESACRVEMVPWSGSSVGERAGCRARVEETLWLTTGLPLSIRIVLDLGGNNNDELELPVFLTRRMSAFFKMNGLAKISVQYLKLHSRPLHSRWYL